MQVSQSLRNLPSFRSSFKLTLPLLLEHKQGYCPGSNLHLPSWNDHVAIVTDGIYLEAEKYLFLQLNTPLLAPLFENCLPGK